MIVSKLVRVCNQGFESLRLCMHYYVYCAQNVKCCYFSMINIDKFKQWQIKFSESCKSSLCFCDGTNILNLFRNGYIRSRAFFWSAPDWLSAPAVYCTQCTVYSVQCTYCYNNKNLFIFEKPLTTRQCLEICWNFFPGSHIIRLKWFWR